MNLAAPPRETEVVRFLDGSTIEMRPLGIRDGRIISQFIGQLSAESEYKRFLSSGRRVRSEWVAKLVNADQHDYLAYGAIAGNEFGSSLIAIAESIRDPGDVQRAEFALAAVDSWQSLGIGTLLTRHVTRIAVLRGIRFWETYMLAENIRMARVMDKVGRRVSFEIDSGLASAIYELQADPTR